MNKFILFSVLICALFCAVLAEEKKEQLRIGVTHRPAECPRKSKLGDTLVIHYTGTLTNGEKFDSSLDRGQPFRFKLGAGQVIKGWDQGLVGMCIGEKRKLQIPPHLAYGERGAGDKIPPNAKLIFTTELIDIE